jgi:hypothetical protein
MNANNQFHRYAKTIASLPLRLEEDGPLPASLLMTSDHRYAVYYAPFDHVTPTARIVLVGITPGRHQALEAISAARRMLLEGADHTSAMAQAKKVASFAGPMRANLVDLLDDIGVAKRLGIRTTAELWGERSDLVHFTSALRYPVFDGGENYSGNRLLKSPLLRGQVDQWFAAECRALKNALYVPLGKAALEACEYLVGSGALHNEQLLRGLPHPSGANAERIAYFLRRKAKASLSAKTNPASIESGRAAALSCVAAWS